MTIKDELRNWINDPMWADHVEVPKVLLRKVLDQIDFRDKLIQELVEHEGSEGFSASTYEKLGRWHP